MKNNKIKGRVFDLETGKGPEGIEVEAWSNEGTSRHALATGLTKKSGVFLITFTEASVKETIRKDPEILLKIYRDGKLMKGPYLEKIYNLNEWIEDQRIEVNTGEEIPDRPGDEPWVVQGIVYDPSGKPVSGLLVKIFNRQLRGMKVLGQEKTSERGRYSVRYKRIDKQVDLSAEVYNSKNKLVYQSSIDETLFNAPARARLDIRLSVDPRPVVSEFDQIMSKVKPSLGKSLTYDQLGETQENPDISFLANETGIAYSY